MFLLLWYKKTGRHEAEQMVEAGEVLKDLIDLYDNLNND